MLTLLFKDIPAACRHIIAVFATFCAYSSNINFSLVGKDCITSPGMVRSCPYIMKFGEKPISLCGVDLFGNEINRAHQILLAFLSPCNLSARVLMFLSLCQSLWVLWVLCIPRSWHLFISWNNLFSNWVPWSEYNYKGTPYLEKISKVGTCATVSASRLEIGKIFF